MDVQIGREFATSLLATCQVSERTFISPECLIEPKFLTAFSDFLENILATWTSLPTQLQTVFQNAFDVNGWRLSNNTCDIFGGDIASWVTSEINSSSTQLEDPATRLYGNLRNLSNPATPMQRLMRQVHLVEFYHLRDIFHIRFTSPSREPLATYIGRRLGLEAEEVRSVCKYFALAGKRLNAIASRLGGFGVLLLPHDIARTTLERRIPLEGPEFDAVVRSLTEQGVHLNEATQSYYDLAQQFFSRRHDEAIHLAEVLYQNTTSTHRSSTRGPPKRISIETVHIEARTANGAGQSAKGNLRCDMAGLFTPQDTIIHKDAAHVTHRFDHHSNKAGVIQGSTAYPKDKSYVEDRSHGSLQPPGLFGPDHGIYTEEPTGQSHEQVLGNIDIIDPIWESMESEISGFRSVMQRSRLEDIGNGF